MTERLKLERERIYKLPEVASLLGVHATTVRRWVRARKLRAFRFNRQWFVRAEDLFADFDKNEEAKNDNGNGSGV